MRRAYHTEHVTIDTSKCTACGDCDQACTHGVLRVRGSRFHRHVHIVRSEDCRAACSRCVEVCAEGAITARD